MNGYEAPALGALYIYYDAKRSVLPIFYIVITFLSRHTTSGSWGSRGGQGFGVMW